MSAVLRLEVLPSSESGHQFRPELQRGKTTPAVGGKDFPLGHYAWKKGWHLFFSFDRLCTSLHLKKNSRRKVKGSTWSPVILSCGITTGQYYPTNTPLSCARLDVYTVVTCEFSIRSYPKSLMHCYEVIPEGSVCKLYFDLEFHKPSNKEADGKAMVTALIQVQCFSNGNDSRSSVWRAWNSTGTVMKWFIYNEGKWIMDRIFYYLWNYVNLFNI